MAPALVVTGIREVDRALAQFAPKFQRKVVRKALRKAGKPVLEAAKAKASEISPRVAGLLTLRSLRSRRRGVLGVRIETTRTLATEDGGVINPHWFEFGVPGHLTFGRGASPLQPRPFVRPAIDAKRGEVAGIFRAELAAIVIETANEVRKN